MRKLNLCFVIVIMLMAMISCQKDQEKQKQQLSKRDIQVTNQLRDFQRSLFLKSTNPMNLEDADWHIEGLLNLEKAYNYHNFVDLQFQTDSIILVSVNGMISGDQIEQAYAYFTDLLDAYSANQGTAFGFDIIDIYSIETELKDGSVVMYMESTSGEELAFNYVPFSEDEYWFWGWNLGGCSGYQGSGDAAQQLQYKFNHPIAVPQGGYFTDVQVETAFGVDYNDPNNPGPYCDYKIFFYELLTPPPPGTPEPCLAYDELNFYLEQFDYIKADKKPPSKTFKCVEVIDDIIPNGTYNRIHRYDLSYGILTAIED
ncbi:MAG: hypothetical protein ISS19_04060 [Bacteroidales bacterium]|nr:hypothetical protein [Bacteroidales bacterium]